ncbi:DinB family protein [Chryseobacterium sp. Chry.R1]|uniref:DinB family protein n=1 Tax=Chryseobacterium sp. Chry.R1 TaxID=3139392 RepID=UPI0027A4C3DE|nr:DinB family protein [Chryseobacterium daecheongense]
MSNTTLTLEEIKESLQHSQKKFLNLLDEVVPIQKLYIRPSSEEWSCGIVFWHIGEARIFFVNEIQKVLDDPSISIGRKMDNPIRLANIEEADKTQPSPTEIRDRLEKSYTEITRLFEKLTPSDLEKEIQHMNPKFGLMKLRDFIDHFIVEHDAIHVAQINRVVSQIN